MERGVQITFVVAVVVMVIAVGALSYKISTQSGEINELGESFELLRLNLETLKETNIALKDQVTILKKESTALAVSSAQTEIEIDETLDKLDDFEKTVRDSMEWFKSNRNIKNLSKFDSWKTELKDECLHVREDLGKCTIDLVCMDEVNRNNAFRYKSDIRLNEKGDFLKSLDLMYDDKRGDCEDFSLLFAAEYNYLIDECMSHDITKEKITLVSSAKKIPAGYMYPVCGSFDPGATVGYYVGHCVVAITSEPIEDASDIYGSLQDAVLIEPQNGKWMFTLDDTNVISLFDDGEVPDTLFYIDFVITGDDLKVFYPWSETIKWTGYKEFLSNAQSLKQQLEV